jgi:purine-nucleoside phosphorylase
MLIDDHVNLMFDNPLVGVNDDRLGPRFPDMSAPYDRRLQTVANEIARHAGIELHQGVYVAVLGPNYETRAEYRMCRRLGGDAVGMSTAPEVLAARHAGMRVLGISTITNIGAPDAPSVTTGHDVIANASASSNELATILRGVIAQLER